MILLGLIGAHRTGKTTLARALGEELGVPVCETRLSQAMREMGVSPQADVPFAERLELQNRLLGCLIDSYQEATTANPSANLIITDRTPMDIAAYTLAEVQRQSLTKKLEADLERHFMLCRKVFNLSFAMGVVVQPGIPLVEDDSKAPANHAYQAHVNACILERTLALRGSVPVQILPIKCLEVSSRVSEISHCFHSIMSTEREVLHADAASQSIH